MPSAIDTIRKNRENIRGFFYFMIGGAYFRNVTVLFVITKLVPFKIHLDPSTAGLKIGHIEPVVNFRVL